MKKPLKQSNPAGRLRRLVECCRLLGVWLGYRYWKLQNKAIADPKMVPLWATALRASADEDEAKGEHVSAGFLRGFATEIEARNSEFHTLNAPGQPTRWRQTTNETNQMSKSQASKLAPESGSSCADLLAVVSATPREIRRELTETIEDIGQAMGLLREAIDDTDAGNELGGQMCGSDALEILSGLESKFAGMAARLVAWANIPADFSGNCDICGEELESVRPGKSQCPTCG